MLKLEYPKFDGNPEDYCALLRYFDENMHNKSIISD